jgi:hypothetical protein
MRGVGGKFALPAETLLKSVECLVYGAHQRHHLLRHPFFRQSQLGAGGTNSFGERRGGNNRSQRASEDHDVDDQQEQQDGRGDPTNSGEELGDDIVDENVAMLEVFGDLK